MPTLEHNGLVDMFRRCPELAPGLVARLLHVEIPRFETVTVVESALDQILPTEFRADLVLELRDAAGELVLSIIIEVQRSDDPDKKFAWPVYLAVVRSRTRRPAIVLVVAPDERVAAWAAESIDLGLGFSNVRPVVLGPSGLPEMTDPVAAALEPDLAVLSAMAHGNGPNGLAVLQAAYGALGPLDPERGAVYFQIIVNVLRAPVQAALEKWIMENRANPVSDDSDLPPFLQRLVQRGEVRGEVRGELKGELRGEIKGKLEGKRETLVHLLGRRGIVLSPDERRRIDVCDDNATLERWIDNLFNAKSAADVFG